MFNLVNQSRWLQFVPDQYSVMVVERLMMVMIGIAATPETTVPSLYAYH